MNKTWCRFGDAVCLLSLVICIPSFGQGAFQIKKQDALTLKLDDRTLGASYDVLGLKLGMSAAEVKRILIERFHVTAGSLTKKGYNVVMGLPQYVPGRPYTELIKLDTEGHTTSITCDFVEVVSGEGKGPEMLYNIAYFPNTVHDPDTQAFIDQVHKKFGKPTEEDTVEGVWGDPAYKSINALLNAGLPTLILSSAGAGQGYFLDLRNNAIRAHMDAVFASRKTTTPPI